MWRSIWHVLCKTDRRRCPHPHRLTSLSTLGGRDIICGKQWLKSVDTTKLHHELNGIFQSLEIPHFGYSTYLDLTNLHSFLPLINAHIPPHYLQSPPEHPPLAVNPSAIYPAPSPPDVPPTGKYTRLTYLPVMLKTLSRAMADWPLFRSSIGVSPNSSAESTKPTLTIRPHADISIALSTPSGLYTPTIQNVNSYSVYSLASRVAHVAALGRRSPSGLTPADLGIDREVIGLVDAAIGFLVAPSSINRRLL